jgi:hypothetical protein
MQLRPFNVASSGFRHGWACSAWPYSSPFLWSGGAFAGNRSFRLTDRLPPKSRWSKVGLEATAFVLQQLNFEAAGKALPLPANRTRDSSAFGSPVGGYFQENRQVTA